MTSAPISAASLAEDHGQRVMSSLNALRKANINNARKRLDFSEAAEIRVMFSTEEWSPFPHIDGCVTRVTERDEDRRIISMSVKWVKSGFITEHYHDQQEEITVTSGQVTIFLEAPNGAVIQADLTKGMQLTIPAGQKHAGFSHAGCTYDLRFHPPFDPAD